MTSCLTLLVQGQRPPEWRVPEHLSMQLSRACSVFPVASVTTHPTALADQPCDLLTDHVIRIPACPAGNSHGARFLAAHVIIWCLSLPLSFWKQWLSYLLLKQDNTQLIFWLNFLALRVTTVLPLRAPYSWWFSSRSHLFQFALLLGETSTYLTVFCG